TEGVAKATCSSIVGPASTTCSPSAEPMILAIRSFSRDSQARLPWSSEKCLPMRSIIAGTVSNSDIAGRSTTTRASVTTPRNASSAAIEARKLGSPNCASRSASGESTIIRMIAVTSGRNTTDPIDSTNGSARNSPSAISTTSAEISRSSSAANASVRRREGGAAGRSAPWGAAPSLSGCEPIGPRPAVLIARSVAPAGGDVVKLFEDRAVRRRIVDRALGYRPLLDHRRQRGAGAPHAALDRAHGAAADLRRLLVGKPAGPDQQQGLAPFGRQGQQRAVHVRQVDRLFLPGRRDEDALGR